MEYSDYSKKLVEILGLENQPIALKFLKPGEAAPQGFETPAHKMRFCQAVMEASWGKFLVIKPSEMSCGPGPASFGEPMREKVARGEVHQAIGLFGSTEAAARCLSANIKIPAGAAGAAGNVLVGGLEKFPVQADVIVLRLNPEQALWICQSRSYTEGKHLMFDVQTEASFCSGLAVATLLRNEIQIALGCYGSRSNTNMKPEEMLVGIPITLLPVIVEILEKMKKPIADSRSKKGYHEAYPEKKQAAMQ